MTWIFGLFLVTLCALTSCHTVMSKQGYDSTSGQCVTRRRQCDENHAVRFRERECRELGVEQGTANQRCHGLQGGASVGTPWLPEEDMGRSPLSEYICLSIYLSTNNKLWALLENKMRDIFIKKCFIRSLNFILSLWLYNKKCLAFANEHVLWSQEKWQMVHFSDESKFLLIGSDGKTYVH